MGRTLEQRAMQGRLVAGTAAGDRASFESLYDEFADLVYSIAMSMLRDPGRAEDAAQDVWVRIWNSAGSFDAERASAATWITTIAHRQVIDVLRRQRARPGDVLGHEPGDEVAAREDAGTDTAHDAITSVTVEAIRESMRELPELQRVSLELAYFEGLTQSEIAERLGKPLGTIKTYMFQGMKKLRVQLAPADAADRQE